jgi:hypothetical protein
VHKRLSEISSLSSIAPEVVRRRLQSSYYSIAAYNTLLYDKLNNILSCFEQAKIGVILLKGMALINTIYPDIALRPMYDIDLLIHKHDFSLVEDKLKELGYMNSSAYPEDFYKDNMMVDIHWELRSI